MKINNIIIIIIITCIFMTSCGLSDEHLSKENIIKVVKDNYELLNKVPDEIKSLNSQSLFISTTKKRPIKNEISPFNSSTSPISNDIEGLYLETINEDSSNSFSSLKNDVFSKVLNINGIMGINNNLSNNRFFINFDYGGEGFGSAMSYYGFYYVEDNLPIGWAGEDVDLIQNGNGWNWKEAEDSDNIYYTERIIDNWFYYKMDW